MGIRHYLWDKHLELFEIALSLLITYLIIVEVRMAKEGEAAQAEQLKTITRLLIAAETQAHSLEGSIAAQQKQAELLASMSGELDEQLKILRAQEAHRLAELSRKPSMLLRFGGLRSGPIPGGIVPFRELTATRATLDLVLTNRGNVAATGCTFRIFTNRPEVNASCHGCKDIPISAPDTKLMAIDIPSLRVGNSIQTTLVADFPSGTSSFLVEFNVDCENLGRQALASITVTPPPK